LIPTHVRVASDAVREVAEFTKSICNFDCFDRKKGQVNGSNGMTCDPLPASAVMLAPLTVEPVAACTTFQL
jgi:hypothetical protein